MVDDNRSRSVSDVALPVASAADGAMQTASFAIGALNVELTAAPGAARIIVAANGSRDTYVVDATALATWATAVVRLLSLTPAANPSQRAEYRAPFLIDREARESIAFEGLVTEQGVAYRLLVAGAAGRVAGLMTNAETVREIAEAATGAAAVASGVVRP